MLKNSILFWVWMALGLYACSNPETKTEQNGEFPIVRPMLQDTVLVKEYVAEINALQNVDIRTRIRGFVEKVHVDEGQMVKEGQILFSISAGEYKEALLSAKALTKNAIAELKTAEIELSNAQTLFEKSVVSAAQLKLLESKVEALKAKLEEARANEANAGLQLSFTEIKAPFAGLINRIPFKAGSLVDEGALMTTLSNNTGFFSYFHLSESDYLNFIRNKTQDFSKGVSLVLANGDLYEFKGQIETVEGEIDHQTGNIAFRARFPNPKNEIRHGATGKILWPETLKNALLIPQKAVFEIQDKDWVYVVNAKNQIELRQVKVASRLPKLYAIGEGLGTQDKVLFEGIQRVKEGDQILPLEVGKEEMLQKLKQAN